MKQICLLLAALGISGSGFAETGPPHDPPVRDTVVTGSRKWRMADGSEQRLRLTGFFQKNVAYGRFSSSTSNTSFPLERFAKEEQEVFSAVKKGDLKLVTTSGLSMNPDFPVGKLTVETRRAYRYWLGESRTWEKTDGKRVESRLICLTDEDVSLLIGDTVGRVSLNDLAPADLDYIERLKRGEARVYPEYVQILQHGWGNAPSNRARLAGERYVGLVKQGSNFEAALAGAISHVSTKLERSKWNLVAFTEQKVHPPSEMYPPSINFGNTPEPTPFYYIAEFSLLKDGEEKSRAIWPYNTTPRSWRGSPMLQIYVMADGEIVPAEPVK